MQTQVAVELDRIQTHMLGILSKIPRLQGELLQDWLIRRARISKKLAAKIGWWSSVWAKRVINWHEHVLRSTKHIHSGILNYQEQNWLIARRLFWCTQNGSTSSRLSPFGGRTDTRICAGRPQQRWEQGVALARQLVELDPAQNSRIRGVGTRIREAKRFLNQFFSTFNQPRATE